MATVTELLDRAHVAHTAYRTAVSTALNPVTARIELQNALDARLAAQTADPLFTDPAWAAESGRYPHVSLLQFYRAELAK